MKTIKTYEDFLLEKGGALGKLRKASGVDPEDISDKKQAQVAEFRKGDKKKVDPEAEEKEVVD